MAWEVEGIDLILTFLRQKREETKRLAGITPVELGMPADALRLTRVTRQVSLGTPTIAAPR